MHRLLLNLGLRDLPHRAGVYVSVHYVMLSDKTVPVEVGCTEVLLSSRIDVDFSIQVEVPLFDKNVKSEDVILLFEAFTVSMAHVSTAGAPLKAAHITDDAEQMSLGRFSRPLSAITVSDDVLGCFEPVFSRLRGVDGVAVFDEGHIDSRGAPVYLNREPPFIVITPCLASNVALNLGLVRLNVAFADIPMRRSIPRAGDPKPALLPRSPFILIERCRKMPSSRISLADMGFEPAVVSIPVRGGGQRDSVAAGKDPNEVICLQAPLASILRFGSCSVDSDSATLLEGQVVLFSVYDWHHDGNHQKIGSALVALSELLNPATIASMAAKSIALPLRASDGVSDAGAIIFINATRLPWTLRQSLFAEDMGTPRLQTRVATPPGPPPAHALASAPVDDDGTPYARQADGTPPKERDAPRQFKYEPLAQFTRAQTPPHRPSQVQERSDTPPTRPPPSAYGINDARVSVTWESHESSSLQAKRQSASESSGASHPSTVSHLRASRLGIDFSGPDNAKAAPIDAPAMNVVSPSKARLNFTSSLTNSSAARDAAASKLLMAPTIHSALGLRPGATALMSPKVPFSNTAEAYETGRAVASPSPLGSEHIIDAVFSEKKAASSALDLVCPPPPPPKSPPHVPTPKRSNPLEGEMSDARSRGIAAASTIRRALASPKFSLAEFSTLLTQGRAAGERGDFLIPHLMALEHSQRKPEDSLRASVTLIAAACAQSDVARRSIEAISTALISHLRSEIATLNRSISDAREEAAACARTSQARSVTWDPVRKSGQFPAPAQIDLLPVEAFLSLEQNATNSRLAMSRAVTALEAVSAPAAVTDLLTSALSSTVDLLSHNAQPGGVTFTADMKLYDQLHDEAMRQSTRKEARLAEISGVLKDLRALVHAGTTERSSLESSRDVIGENLAIIATEVAHFEGLTWVEPDVSKLAEMASPRSQKFIQRQGRASVAQLLHLSADPRDETAGKVRRQEWAISMAQQEAVEKAAMAHAPLLSAMREKTQLAVSDIQREGEDRMQTELGSSNAVYQAGLRDAMRAREAQADEVAKLLGISRSPSTSALPSSIALTYARFLRPTSDQMSRLDTADEEARIAHLSRVTSEEQRRLQSRLAEVDADLKRIGARDEGRNKLALIKRDMRAYPAWLQLPIATKRDFLSQVLASSPYSSALSAFLRSEVYPHTSYRARTLASAGPSTDNSWQKPFSRF